MTFEHPEDYDWLDQGTELTIRGIDEGMASGKMTVTETSTGRSFTALCNFTDRQQAILKAGGLLNYTKEGNV